MTSPKTRDANVIDLRSDTVTVPDAGMRRAMAEAEVGDDVYCEDPTVTELEMMVAGMAGKAAGLFVPTGTMSNLLAVMVHCHGSASPGEIIVGDRSHMFNHECGGAAVVARVQMRPVPTQPDGSLKVSDIKAAIRPVDVHFGTTRMLAIENTHNFCGGAALQRPYLDEVRTLCKEHRIVMHCDGARLWHAAIALQTSLSELAEPFESISLCLSKGLGAPAGSVLVGPTQFIATARRLRKMLGGGMRQVGVLAAAGLYALKNVLPRLREDHENAEFLALGLERGGYEVLPCRTNIVIIVVPEGTDKALIEACGKQGVKLSNPMPGYVRAVPHWGQTRAQVERALSVILSVRV